MEVKFGKSATLIGNGQRQVRVQADGQVGRTESAGVDRHAEGFLPSLQDERIEQFLVRRDAVALGGRWQSLPDQPGSADCGDQRVWKYGGTQQVNADFAAHTVSLDTLGSHGQHTITGRYDESTGHVNPKTITETFEPYNTAYVAMMRDNY